MSLAGQQTGPARVLYHLLWSAVDWIYPPHCGGCDSFGERWCSSCQEKIEQLGDQVCPFCGYPSSDKEVCPACRASTPPYNALRSFGFFSGPLREALHRLKYRQDIGLGEVLSNHLNQLVNQQNWQFELITAVPLSQNRLRQRGYNQASLLAWPIALARRIPYLRDSIKRIKDTRSQVGLTVHERSKNVEDAFRANPQQVSGKRVLIVDDVTTTGATIRACAEALLAAGASGVYGITLARAILHHDKTASIPDDY
jgi:competence protein ComFC